MSEKCQIKRIKKIERGSLCSSVAAYLQPIRVGNAKERKGIKMKVYVNLFVYFVLVCCSSEELIACTGIRLVANDKSVVYGRTMEWGAFNLKTELVIIPRKTEFVGLVPKQSEEGERSLKKTYGKKWSSQYGFVALKITDDSPGMFFGDGMNENGLAIGSFYHDGFADYNDYDSARSNKTISSQDLVAYVLSRCATVQDVRDEFKDENIRVVAVKNVLLKKPVYFHWMITDSSGSSIVVEFINRKVKIYENTLGVITNNPTYDWHLLNLRNYVNLSANPKDGLLLKNEDIIKPMGSGSNMLGLPGDFTPPSRFVRAVAWTQTARHTDTSTETIYELFRILDNFNRPVEGGMESAGMRSSTQWTTGWDLTKKILYYHTQHNRRVRRLKFDLCRFEPGSEKVANHLDYHGKKQDMLDILP